MHSSIESELRGALHVAIPTVPLDGIRRRAQRRNERERRGRNVFAAFAAAISFAVLAAAAHPQQSGHVPAPMPVASISPGPAVT